MQHRVEIAVFDQLADGDGVLLVARRLRLLVGIEVVHADHVVFEEGAAVGKAALICVVVEARVHVAEHGVPEVGAFALDHVEHAMGERSQPGRWMDSGTPVIFEARAAPRSTFSSAAVKSLLTPISPMIPAQTSGSSSEPAAVGRDRLGDRRRRHLLHISGMRRLEIEAGAHDDVEPGRRLIRCNADGSRPMPRLVGSTTVWPPCSTKCLQFLDRGLGVEQPAIVAVEEWIHPQLAEHRDVERPLGDGDLRGAAGPLPPARGVEQDMLVHQRHAHRLDRDRAEHCPHRAGMDADRGFGHVARSLLQPVRPPGPEQAEVQPDRDEDDDALDDRRQERRHDGRGSGRCR